MIPDYAEELDFENRLPCGQAPILTQSVQRFHAFLQFIMQSRELTGYATMGVVTGAAGVGKTMAVQTFLQALHPRAYSGFPACVSIKVPPRATAKALAKLLIHTLNGESATHNIYDLEALVTDAIRRTDLDLVLVDEGDWLTVESFEMLRHVFDRTGCPIVLVGLPRLLRVITQHEKFVSRVGLHLEFLPPTQEEVLTTILPGLKLPYWQYRPEDSADQQMGIQLWQRVGPSLRKLRVVLQYASQIAQARQAERITPEILAETQRLTLLPHLPPPRQPAPAAGPYEAASEQRPPRA